MQQQIPETEESNIIALTPSRKIRRVREQSNEADRWFEHDGRRYTVYTRSDKPGASLYIRFDYDGQTWKKCLETGIWKVAVERACNYIDTVRSGKWDCIDALKSRRSPGEAVATVGQILAHFENAKDLEISEKAHRAVPQALRNCIRKALGWPVAARDATYPEREAMNAEVNALSGSIFTKSLAQQYWKAMREAANVANQVEGQAAATRVRVSWASLLTQAKEIFTASRLAAYERDGIQLPATLHEFLFACKAERPRGLVSHYDPPPEKIIQDTLHAWAVMEDRNLFLAVGHELAFGLRRGEVEQLLWGHHTVERGRPLLDSRRVRVKNESGIIVVTPLDPFWTVLANRIRREGWRGGDEEPVIPLTKTQFDDLFRQVGLWLRSHGWETQKTNHALRAYAGSLVASKWDVWRASTWLRHSSVKVTQNHYLKYLNSRMLTPSDIKARWGRRPL